MKQLGTRIRKLREAQSLTQNELAKKVGLGQSGLSKLERGVAGDLRAKTLIKIAKVLGISLDVLAGRRSERVIRSPDFVLRSHEPLDLGELGRRLRQALTEESLENCYAITEQFEDDDGYAVAVEVRRLRSKSRRLTGDARQSVERAEAVIAAALEEPKLGCQRLSYELLKRGVRISSSSVHNWLNAEGLSTRQDRAERLRRDAEEGKTLTPKQRQVIETFFPDEKKKKDDDSGEC